MADLRDYQPLFFGMYRALSKQRTSAKYIQVRASGCDRFDLHMTAGKIESMQFKSSLMISRLIGEKKSFWKTAEDTASNFNFLNQWKENFELLLASGKKSEDPRPSFAENPRYEELQPGLRLYDPEVAQLIPAVIFHRIFQLLSPVLEKGFLVDFSTTWRHGASFWNDVPMTFAWADANGFYFGPQTRIDESICIYHPERPRLRRFVEFTSWRISDIPSILEIAETMDGVKSEPLLTWSKRNIDKIVFLPQAVSSMMSALLSLLSNENVNASVIPSLNSTLELADEPENPLFQCEGMIDARGRLVKSVSIIKNGEIQPFHSLEHAHFSDKEGHWGICCPILKPVTSDETSDMSPENLSRQIPGRILFIEKIQLLPSQEGTQVFVPAGGVLYREGKCLGHVVAPPQTLRFDDIWGRAKPIGSPVRTGAFATCALEIEI